MIDLGRRLPGSRSAGACVLLAALAPLLITATGAGQPTKRPRRALEPPSPDCRHCHSCDTPTPETRCLRTCTRNHEQEVLDELTAKRGPQLVLLDELEDRYLPVPFDHQGHAEMAEMTNGCAACHHYTPEGAKHPACKTCHEVAPAKEDIAKPGLKGAYHRQCMNCHREWSGETRCGVCHHPKTGVTQRAGPEAIPTKDDIMGRIHPPIPEPEVEVYITKREGYPETHVAFRHKAHIHEYDLRCADCHKEDSCSRCHAGDAKHVQRTRSLDEHHKPCVDCHRDQACDRCHFEPGRPQPPPFDHARTGWPLQRYHQNKSCRACHVRAPYAELDRACNTCHASWTPATFNHAATGQGLDKTHVSQECEECHAERRFDRPPRCDGCHEEDEGITFPAKRPGPRTPGREPDRGS
ncbi:MAG: cytochrome c3 family protein [Planctomycetes bacterium]|nr:cytochrome c3 family protein [Planctomycetota bacterium]